MSSHCPVKRSPEDCNDDSPSPPKKLCRDSYSTCNIEELKLNLKSDYNTANESESKDNESLKVVSVNIGDAAKTCLTEKDVGVTEYISSLPGFSAVVKERYSDFLVNEIDLEGNIIRLTDMNAPKSEPLVCCSSDVFSSDEMKCIEELSNGTSSDPVVLDVTDKDKDLRRKLHEAIRQHFVGLESTTSSSGLSKTIVIQKKSGQSRKCPPSNRSNYTHFVLYKENKDTMDAISTISSILRLSPKHLSYAGTKDKRAKTSQAVSAYRVDAQKLLGLNKKLNLIKIGNVMYKDSQIKLGNLCGNYFTIVLRQSKGDADLVKQTMESLATRGFINYYGMQRFGTTSIATHCIGRALIQGKWKEAIDLILKPRDGVADRSLVEARKIWSETRDAEAALAVLRFKDCIEGRLLKGLATHGKKDFVNALNSIPRNTRLMYVHSYQSYIWNKVVSRRIKAHSLKVLTGDLIAPDDTDPVYDGTDNLESAQSLKVPPRYANSDDLSEEDLIYSVVLPLPGHSILYPENETKSWYEEFLKEDGMDFDSFRSNVKSYSLGGAYRKVVIKPSEVKWELIQYDDVCQPLVLSDYDVIQGVTLPSQQKDGKHEALKIELRLPTSSYATMAVREILKVDTCLTTQKALCNPS